jgi:hypothetical protein
VLVISGRDRHDEPLADEVSLEGATAWARASAAAGATAGSWRPDQPGTVAGARLVGIRELLGTDGPRPWQELISQHAAIAVALADGTLLDGSRPPDSETARAALGSPALARFVEAHRTRRP